MYENLRVAEKGRLSGSEAPVSTLFQRRKGLLKLEFVTFAFAVLVKEAKEWKAEYNTVVHLA